MTEAEIAIRKALHELDVQRGAGVFNIPDLRRILELGLTPAPAPKLVMRPVSQFVRLLDLDDNGGH